LGVTSKAYAVATVHRAGNTDNHEAFAKIMSGLGRVDLPVILPAHPRIREQLERLHQHQPIRNLRICDPLSYTELIALQLHARVVMTDSGGMQKEAYVLGTPCVTLRRETEWTETLTDGWNVLAGQDPQVIAAMAARECPRALRQPFYGTGETAATIAGILCEDMSTQRSMVG
jgi:UDP-N-acetylglucosamine 2-epimerase